MTDYRAATQGGHRVIRRIWLRIVRAIIDDCPDCKRGACRE